MKILKAAIVIILTIIIASSCAAIAGAAVEEITKSITVTQYKSKTVSVKDTADGDFSIYGKVTKGDKKAVKVEFDSWKGNTSLFSVTGKKTTGKKPVTVSFIKKNTETGATTVLKTIKVTVKKPSQTKFKTIKLSKGKNLVGALKTRGFTELYKLKIKNNKIAKFAGLNSTTFDDTYSLMSFNAYKKGTTKADVYVKDVKVGTVKIKVGNYKPYFDTKNHTITMKYNSHGRAADYYPSDITDYLRNYNYSHVEKLTFKTNTKYITYKKNALYPFAVKKTGKTSITVLDGKKKLATVKVKIVKGTMAEVYENNLGGDSDADFLNYENYLPVTNGDGTFNIFKEIDSIVLNNKGTGTSFSEKDYTITYSTKDTDYISVDNSGVVHATSKALEADSVTVDYTIKFADNSKFKGVFTLYIY